MIFSLSDPGNEIIDRLSLATNKGSGEPKVKHPSAGGAANYLPQELACQRAS